MHSATRCARAEEALLALTPASAAGALAVLRYARELADEHTFPLFKIDNGDDLAYSLLDWAERTIAGIDGLRRE